MLEAERSTILRTSAGLEVATVTREGRAWVVRDRGAGGLWVRGKCIGEAAIAADGAVLLGREPVVFGATSGPGVRWHGIVAADPRSLAGLGRLAVVAAARSPVWISGESGTGKEAAARVIHGESPRAAGPYVALNCAAVPESLAEAELFGTTRGAFTGAVARAGAFVRADGGTLLLDEVGELPLSIQAKLLRVIETGEVTPVGAEKAQRVDVRVIAASWRDLEGESSAGRFRHDLLHRLWVLKVELLPLRERIMDVPVIVAHMLAAGGAPELMPGSATIAAMQRYEWPGNVRELGNYVERALAFRDPLAMLPRSTGPMSLPRRSKLVLQPGAGLDRLIEKTLETYGHHRGRAARALGISRSTLYRWFRALPRGAPTNLRTRPSEGGLAGH